MGGASSAAAADVGCSSIRTRATPSWRMPMAFAADDERSMIRSRATGPRSVIRTTTDRPVERSVTRTRVPNGSDGCAAVSAAGSSGSPSAMRVWPGSRVYHDASPCSAHGAGAAACCRGAAQAASRNRRKQESEAARMGWLSRGGAAKSWQPDSCGIRSSCRAAPREPTPCARRREPRSILHPDWQSEAFRPTSLNDGAITARAGAARGPGQRAVAGRRAARRQTPRAMRARAAARPISPIASIAMPAGSGIDDVVSKLMVKSPPAWFVGDESWIENLPIELNGLLMFSD